MQVAELCTLAAAVITYVPASYTTNLAAAAAASDIQLLQYYSAHQLAAAPARPRTVTCTNVLECR